MTSLDPVVECQTVFIGITELEEKTIFPFSLGSVRKLVGWLEQDMAELMTIVFPQELHEALVTPEERAGGGVLGNASIAVVFSQRLVQAAWHLLSSRHLDQILALALGEKDEDILNGTKTYPEMDRISIRQSADILVAVLEMNYEGVFDEVGKKMGAFRGTTGTPNA